MQNSAPKTLVHTAIRPKEAAPEQQERMPEAPPKNKRRKESLPERLLRNTAIACALLLGILTLKNVDTPWSQAAIGGIEAALTMRIDPDESLGKLSFVRSVIPESTLVFFNISGSKPLEPVEGEVIHRFSEGQPWTLYSCAAGAPVRCVLAGTVSAVVKLDSGDWCMMVDHGGGVETMYAYIDKPSVDAGESVARGEAVAKTLDEELYYEYRVNGESVSPGAEAWK